MSTQQDLDDEQAVVIAVQRLAGEIADACGHLARWGDGNCGSVIEYVIDALRQRGHFHDIDRTPKNGYAKKKIGNRIRTLVFERDEYRCRHCSTHIDLCVDHIKPERQGGELELSNLQTLCRSCNSKKGYR